MKAVEKTPLTGADILGLNDRGELKKIHIPEWHTDVYVRILSGIERDTWELRLRDAVSGKGKANLRAALAVMCLCDESGKRLFKDSDAEALGEKSAVALDRVFDVAKRLNALDEKDVEKIEGN